MIVQFLVNNQPYDFDLESGPLPKVGDFVFIKGAYPDSECVITKRSWCLDKTYVLCLLETEPVNKGK